MPHRLGFTLVFPNGKYALAVFSSVNPAAILGRDVWRKAGQHFQAAIADSDIANCPGGLQSALKGKLRSRYARERSAAGAAEPPVSEPERCDAPFRLLLLFFVLLNSGDEFDRVAISYSRVWPALHPARSRILGRLPLQR